MATYSNIQYHFVFSTKHRDPWIGQEIRQDHYDYIGGIVRGEGGVLYAIGGMPDHIHLLVRWGAVGAIEQILRILKSKSSGWVHRTFPSLKASQWQAGYGAFSVSQSQSERVKRYVEDQFSHHATMTFQDELLELLRRHRIEYDNRYIWD